MTCHSPSQPKLSQGFSLVESLTVVAIITVTTMIATPSYQTLIETQRAESVQHRMARLIKRARQHAIAHNQTVSLCGSQQGLHCDGEWSDGVLVYAQRPSPDNTADILEFHQLINRGSLRWNRNSNHLRFNALGVTYSTNGSFIYCAASGAARFAQRIVVAKTGRVRLPGFEPRLLLCG